MKSEVLDNGEDILQRIDWRTEVVGFDEANFMGPSLIESAGTLAESITKHWQFVSVVETQPSIRNV